MRNKLIICQSIVCLGISILISCISSINRKKVFDPEIDCVQPTLFDFASFQDECRHSSRTQTIFVDQFEKCKEPLSKLLEQHEDKFSNVDSVGLIVRANCNGAMFGYFRPRPLKDAHLSSDIKEIFKNCKLDSIYPCKAIAKIQILIVDKETFIISDSVKFFEGRSKRSIMFVVMKNLPNMKAAYNRHTRVHGWFKGKVTYKFAIDEYGNVIDAEVIMSTVNNRPEFETEQVKLIKGWKFPRINNPGDVTEIVYPFRYDRY